MSKFKKLIIGNNGVDIYTADGEFKEIATVLDKDYVNLFCAAPDLLDSLLSIKVEAEMHGIYFLSIHKAGIAIEKALNIKK